MKNVNAQLSLALKKRMQAVRKATFEYLNKNCSGGVGQEHIDFLVQKIAEDNRVAGLSVVPILNGQPLNASCVGEAVRGSTKVQAETRIRVHSISKLMGGIVLMRFWEEGKIDLDRDISEYFGFEIRNPRYRNIPITLRQLMTHTSSLHDNGDYLDMGTECMKPLSAYFSRENAAKNFTTHRPGTNYAYSNLGAGMQGALVEKLTGRDFDSVAHEILFDPLGLDAGYYPQRIREKALMANIHRYPEFEISYNAHAIAARPAEEYADPEMHYTTMPGRVIICMPQLARIAQLLMNGGELDGVRILREETVQMMMTAQNKTGSVLHADRGLNVDIAEDAFAPGRTLYGHQGGAYGGSSELWVEPETGSAVVMATTGGWYRPVKPFSRVGHDTVTVMLAVLDFMRGAREA